MLYFHLFTLLFYLELYMPNTIKYYKKRSITKNNDSKQRELVKFVNFVFFYSVFFSILIQ